MDNKRNSLTEDNNLIHWMSSLGYLYPRNEGELIVFDKMHKDFKSKLDNITIDPNEIILGNFVKKGTIRNLKMEIDIQDLDSLRMAARKGDGSIPDEILKKMKSKHKNGNK